MERLCSQGRFRCLDRGSNRLVRVRGVDEVFDAPIAVNTALSQLLTTTMPFCFEDA